MKQTSLTATQLATYLGEVQAIMDAHGFAVQGVGAGETTPTLIYTVGLSKTTAHELVIVGLPIQTAAGLLNQIAEVIKAGHLVLTEHTVFADIANFPLRVRMLPFEEAVQRCPVVSHLCRDKPIVFAQIVWPDSLGIFPDEPGCNENAVKIQSL